MPIMGDETGRHFGEAADIGCRTIHQILDMGATLLLYFCPFEIPCGDFNGEGCSHDGHLRFIRGSGRWQERELWLQIGRKELQGVCDKGISFKVWLR